MAREAFLDLGVETTERFLAFRVRLVGGRRYDGGEYKPQNHGAERPEGELNADANHDNESADDGHHCGDELRDAFLQGVGHPFCVVGHAA